MTSQVRQAHCREGVLKKLQGAKKMGEGRWQALCPAHEDRKPSLSITEAENGVLLHCHAGCSPESVVQAVGLNMSDLFHSGDNDKHPPDIVETYDYTDTGGNLLYQVVRYSPKDFKQRRPDGNGGWTWDLKDVGRVLYRLPKVKQAVSCGETVYIVEGEKDVHALESIGLTATCNSGGAGKWEGSSAESLKGASAVILPDNDEPGRRHAMNIAQNLQGVARSVKLAELPGLPPKGDVTDWLAVGHTKDELLTVVDSVPEWMPEAEPQAHSEAKTFALTDLGNAERLIHHYGQDLRYVCDWKRWIAWNNVRWVEDDNLQIERLAKGTVREIYGEAEAVQDSQERKAIAQWAVKSESCERIAAMIRLAQSEVTVTADKLDVDPYLLCCRNGVLDLRTGEILNPHREDYITKQIPVEYDAGAECPLWHTFLERVLPDVGLRDYVQKAVGYTLTGDVSEQCLFFLYGDGKNGKSTFIEAISSLMGDYFTKARSDTLMMRRNGGIPNDVAALAGSRLVTVSEVSGGQKLDEGLVKDLTGGDTMAARFLYTEHFNFKAGFKLWLYGNHKPTIRGKDEGIWRRIRLIPFTVQIPEAERDGHLPDKLAQELPGILRWAVEGCLLWQKEGLHEPEAVRDAVNEYRREQDGLADFLAESCIVDRKETIAKKELWSVYQSWADSTGEDCFESQRMFNAEIRNRPGIKEGRGAGNAAIWKGIAFKEQLSGEHGELPELP